MNTIKHKQPAYLKMNQIIALSVSYKTHRKQVLSPKPAVDNSNHKRNIQIAKLRNQKLQYAQSRRSYNTSRIQYQNQKMVKRISNINATMQVNDVNRSRISTSKNDTRNISKNQSRKALKSASSRDSLYSVTSNFRTRTIKHQQIKRQNQKIALRLLNPKKSNINFKNFEQSFKKDQQIVKVRSRYSDKNQDIIKSLLLQGLHLQKKQVSFLPQIYKNSIQKKSTSKARLKTKSVLN